MSFLVYQIQCRLRMSPVRTEQKLNTIKHFTFDLDFAVDVGQCYESFKSYYMYGCCLYACNDLLYVQN